MEVIIRPEEEKDYTAVEELTREAFYNLYVPGCEEHYLVHIMRDHEDFIKELAFVAEYEGAIIGNIMYTRSWLENEAGEKMDIATFGPVCVHPDYQRKGVGRQLINHTKKLALEMGIKVFVIFGNPNNYITHGFQSCKDCNVNMGGDKYPYSMLVLELEKGALADHSWIYKQSAVYTVDPEAAEAYDKTLPPKEKKYQPSQTLFAMAIRAFVE